MLKVGKIYKLTHTTKGTFKCRIVYIAKKHVYATIIDIGTVFEDVLVGEDVRMLKRHIKIIKEK